MLTLLRHLSIVLKFMGQLTQSARPLAMDKRQDKNRSFVPIGIYRTGRKLHGKIFNGRGYHVTSHGHARCK